MSKKLIAVFALAAVLFTSVGMTSGFAALDDEYIKLGDCNEDGIVNAKDVITLKLHINGKAQVNEFAADANQDGAINKDDMKSIAETVLTGNTVMVENHLPEDYVYQISTVDNMMGYIVVSNGKVCVIDGGLSYRETDTTASQNVAVMLIKKLRELTGEQVPTVDKWLFTHGHGDHIGVFHDIVDIYPDSVNIVDVYYNIDKNWYDTYAHTSTLMNDYVDVLSWLETNLPQENRHVLNTVGERIQLSSDAYFDVMYVPPYNYTEDYINNASVVYKLTMCGQTVLFLGDAAEQNGQQLLASHNAGNIDLKSDIVQMAHHGQKGIEQNVYAAISPRVCLWPTADWVWDNSTGNLLTLDVRTWMDDLGVTMHYKSYDGDDRIDFPYDFMPDNTVWQVGNKDDLAMSYAVVSDGQLCVIDGGQAAEAPVLYKFLQNLTGNSTPTVDKWILTHAGVDHVGALSAMMNSTAYKLTVNNLYYSDPSTTSAWVSKYSNWGNNGYSTFTTALSSGSNRSIVKNSSALSLNQTISLGTASFKVLYTLKDCYNIIKNYESLYGSDYALAAQDAASVLRLTFENGKTMLFLSDAYDNTATYLNAHPSEVANMYALQMAWHGESTFNNLYNTVNPTVCFWPTYRSLWSSSSKLQNTLNVNAINGKVHCQAFEGATRLTF